MGKAGGFAKRNSWYGGGIQKEEIYNKYGDADSEIGIGALGNIGLMREFLFSEIPEGGSLIEGDLYTPRGINQFLPDIPKQELTLAKIGN